MSPKALRAVYSIFGMTLLQACAGGKEPSMARSPSAESAAPAQYAAPPAQAGYPTQSPSGYPSQPGMPAPVSPSAPSGAARSDHIRSFYQLSVELDQAGADCRSACRALGAMDRAAGELCDIDGRDGICKDAESRVRDARDKVRGVCGTCPEGTTLDRNAPVPSHR
jgi:hypothetical protein